MAKYLSIDTEATGLEIDSLLLQMALVPVDGDKRIIGEHLGREILVQCPSFEELKPKLNQWVIQHNEPIIRQAHERGLSRDGFTHWMTDYLTDPEIKKFLGPDRPVILGKSLSALDIPILTRYLGKSFMEKHFHHHTLDITCAARLLVDAKVLPEGCQSTTKLLSFFKMRDESTHTALNDAMDMAKIYFKLLDLLPKSR